MLGDALNPTLNLGVLLVTAVLVVLALHGFGVSLRDPHQRLRERWIFGVPWGTIIAAGLLLFVYVVIQRGFWHPNRPVIVAYTAVSMFDPTGWLLAGFAHTSPGHLRGNVTSLLVFGPIVEWAWRHKRPDGEPSDVWWRVPWIRAAILFPVGIVGVGILAALFSWGPVIGFSVAVYALMGIALVTAPVLALVALVAREALRQLWHVAADPVVITETSIRAVRPGWYGTAVQGHLVGLLLGVAIGVWWLRRRDRHPGIGKLWLSSVLLGLYLSLWAVWWILGPERFVLFRAVGVALTIVVATVIAFSVVTPAPELPRLREQLRVTALGILLVSILAMGVVGVGLNLATAEAPPGDPVTTAGDYEIYYAENVPDGMVNIIDVEVLGLTTDVRTSGVIVYSDDRNVWRQMVSRVQLQARGGDRFTVGGLGWSEEITAQRTGWNPVGNATVYQVWVGDDDGWHHAFASDPSTPDVVIDDREFMIAAQDGQYFIGSSYDGDHEWDRIPSHGESVTVHDVNVTRDGRELIAAHEGTEVTIATRETYN